MTNKAHYINFCKKEKGVPLFSQPWHLNATCGSENWEVAIAWRGEEIAATLPYFRTQKWGFQILGTPHLSKYLGVFITKKFRKLRHQHKLMKDLIEQLPNFHFFEQSFHPSVTNWLPFHWENFQETTRYTFILEPINDLEKVFANFNTDYRNNKIPKAEKMIQITSNRSLEEFYDVQKKSFDRQKIVFPFSFDFLKNYDQILHAHHARKIFFAVDSENRVHSVLYLVWDHETAYYHMAGDDPDLRNSGASVLLTWQAIQYASTVLRLNRFDFEGSMIEPITRARRQFGAQQVPYFNIKKYGSVFFRILKEFR